MKSAERFKAFSITIPPPLHRQLDSLCRHEARSRSEVVREALRLYFGARRGRSVSFPVALPSDAEERRQAEFGAFTEWASDLDCAYDVLAEK
jgi:Arc/MetJ-type ribon-helix-helix transcriptional regulator